MTTVHLARVLRADHPQQRDMLDALQSFGVRSCGDLLLGVPRDHLPSLLPLASRDDCDVRVLQGGEYTGVWVLDVQ